MGEIRASLRGLSKRADRQRTGRPLRVNCLWPDRRRGAQRVWFYPRACAGGDLVAVVMAGRLALSLLLQSHREKPLLPALRGRMTGVRPAAGLPLAAALDNTAAGGDGHCLSVSRHKISADRGHSWADLRSAWPGLNIVVGLAGLLDLGYVAFYAIGAYGPALGYQYTWLLGDAAAGGGDGGSRRGVAGLSGAAYAWRLSGHRHPRLWRNYPRCSTTG